MQILYLINSITYIINGYFFNKLITSFVPPKNNKFLKVLSYFSSIIIPFVIIYTEDVFNISFTMLFFFGIMLLCFKGKVIEKISVVLILYPIIVAFNFFVNYISLVLYLKFPHNFSAGGLLFSFENIVICLFWYLIFKTFYKQIQSIRGVFDSKTWVLIDLISLAPFVAIYFSIILTPMDRYYNIYITALACIITNLGVIYLICSLSEHLKVKAENQNLKLEATYYQELMNNQDEIRKMKHDLNNHVSVIATLIDDNNLDDAKLYFNKLSERLNSSGKVFCKNSIVNAVINAKYNYAMEHNIDCFFHIDMDGLLPIDSIDLCSLFSNTLDNAIEACLKLEDSDSEDDINPRKISLKVRYLNNLLSFELRNSFDGIVLKTDETFHTTKEDKKLHGIGLNNITNIINKYNGILQVKYNEDAFIVFFTIRTI